MKSDEEFLKGVYEKVDKLRHADEVEDKWSVVDNRKIPVSFYRYGALAAACIVIIIGSVQSHLSEMQNQDKPEIIKLVGRGARVDDALDRMLQAATDIIEFNVIRKDDHYELELVQIYRGNTEATELLSIINNESIELTPGKTGVAILQKNAEGLLLMELFVSDTADKNSFINQSGDSITRASLEQYLQ